MGKRITTVLQDHDAVLAWLAGRIQSARGSEREFVQHEFLQCVGTHVLAIDSVLKPVLQQVGVSSQLSDWCEANENLKSGLAEALTSVNDEARFDAALKRITTMLNQVREQEGERLATLLTQHLSDGELRLLGADVRLFLGHRVCKLGRA